MLNYLATFALVLALASQAEPPNYPAAQRVALKGVTFECPAPLVVAMQKVDGYILVNFDVKTMASSLKEKEMVVMVTVQPLSVGPRSVSQVGEVRTVPVTYRTTVYLAAGENLYTFAMETREADKDNPELRKLFQSIIESVRLKTPGLAA